MQFLQRRFSHFAAATLLAALPFVTLNAMAADVPASFDDAAQERHVPLPPDPLNPQAKPRLSCFTYAGFMVKQIDRGEKGAAQLSILPLGDQPAPECREANMPGEKVIEGKDWTGYFRGVKGNYVFFDADDGVNGGVGFAIYDGLSGTKLFDDSMAELHTITTTPTGLKMRYARIYSAECSLMTQGVACWEKVVQMTGLTAPQPDCTASYKAAQTQAMTAEQMASDPSVIEYEVETVVDGGTAKTTPLFGKVTCTPAE